MMPNFMQGGMFGPSGGPQGMGGLTEEELRMVMGGQQGGIGGQMPQYNQAPAGGPPPPQTIGGVGQGVDPSMIGGGAQGGLDGMDFGEGAITGGMGQGQAALMGMAQQNMRDEEMAKMLAQMAAMQGGGAGGMAQAPSSYDDALMGRG
jgi:hypothetical protein